MRKAIIKILNWGIQQRQSPLEQRRIRLLNIVAWLSIISNALYLPYLVYNGSILSIANNLLGAIIFFVVIILNRKYLYRIARLAACIDFSFYFMVLSLGTGETIGLEYYLLFTAILPILFFDKWYFYIPMFTLNVVIFLIIKISYDLVEPFFLIPTSNGQTNVFISLANAVNVFVLLFLIINSFKDELLAYQRNSEEKNKVLAESYEEIQVQNFTIQQKTNQLSDAYSHIKSSIEYAQRIQSALLGKPTAIQNYFSEAFIFFRPKDIVSGDFYWLSENKENSLVFLVIADCTGHGIPGAFMTVMGANFLDEIVNEQKVNNPAQILHRLDFKITTALYQVEEEREVNDGMDLVLLCYDKKEQKVHFSGAKNPLYLVRSGEIQQFEGNKLPIGSHQYNQVKNFQTQTLALSQGDTIYLSSDGFQDQFGGEKNRKYMKKRFREFLLQISSLPIEEQKHQLTQELESWKGTQEQTDDILIAGLRF